VDLLAAQLLPQPCFPSAVSYPQELSTVWIELHACN